MIDLDKLVQRLNLEIKGRVELCENGQAICADPEDIVNILKVLKGKFNYTRLMDVTSVDYEDNFEVVYHLMNDEIKLLSVKVKLEKDRNKMPSIVSLWRYAEAMEREIYDLMGIAFEGNGNLKRILTPEDFEGHPLQKSFKLDVVDRFKN